MWDFYRKKIWNDWEIIVKNFYQKKWYLFVEQNFCLRWWEIDLIMRKWLLYVFIEVKVVNNTENLHWYISKRKKNIFKKTINFFLYEKWLIDIVEIRVDFVFVKNWKILFTVEWEYL